MPKDVFAGGLSLPEGPVALADGSWLVVEGGPRGCVTHISPDGLSKRVVAKTGAPNGLAVDGAGAIWVAETRPPSVLRVTLGGEVEAALSAYQGKPCVYPNDLCFGPDGALYFTESGITDDELGTQGVVRPDAVNLHGDGRVYRFDPRTRALLLLDSGLRYPNGIAFGPDRRLYVNETFSGMVYRYPWRDGIVAGSRQEFGNVVDPKAASGFKGPDGMAFGADGRLYVAVFGQRDVTVLGPEGGVVQRIPTAGQRPTNVAFGLPGQKRIYVTEYELGQIEVFDVDTDGLPLWR